VKKNSWEVNIWPSFTDVIVSVFMVMIFIFVIFFAKNYFDIKRLKHLEDIVGKVEKELKAFEELFGEEFVKNDKNGKIKIVLSEDSMIEFPLDSSSVSSISPNGQKILVEIGGKLKSFLDKQQRQVFAIAIEGYTDRSGEDNENYQLSYKRANSIMLFWDKKCDLDPDRYDISPVGFGEQKGKLKVDEEGRIKANRRIEIRLIPKFNELFNKKNYK